ncbi:MAG: hypothetical protein Q8K81_07920 [Sulfuricurvum sp.]|nr:hypothetical protein [Sulfuricurvum sp.]
MKILLLNDNPVVRKLVALSAQKTKDELSVIWSVDEVEGDAYDLLIVDDAHYSDEAMDTLKAKIGYKTSLFMATRGNETPTGFDNVINKPFLPTDLVDLFSEIAQNLSQSSEEVMEEESPFVSNVTQFDTDIEEFGVEDDEDYNMTHLDDGLHLDDFDTGKAVPSELIAKTNVLDQEEVQELQDLLDDTDDVEIDEEFSLDELVGDEDEMTSSEDEDLLGSFDDLLAFEDEEIDNKAVVAAEELENEDLDSFLLDGLEDMEELDEDEVSSSLESTDVSLSDDEFGELEQQIQEAVDELGIEDLEQGVDDVELGDLSAFEGIDELDGLNEREIKLAIGEPVEEEAEVPIADEEYDSLDHETLSEAMETSAGVNVEDELETVKIGAEKSIEEHHGTPAEGMETLQALLKALSNDDVAKTLKGLSINININFGNEK